ncbi:hypothetical protein ACQ856_12205 [Mycolicibacterium psychrotolerans]|uniref:hypothetical protein n=1 Tax=Mycolicibacterium psychrotolerans TaxID=216929 RepID=UPI003D66A5A2
MNRLVLSVVSAVFTAVLVIGLGGTGVASAAPNLTGLTFGKASEKIQGWGGTAVISSVVGSQLATDDCIVTDARESITLDSSGRSAHRGRWLFDLNCNAAVAGPGKPGNSAASPDGAKAKKIEGWIASWNKKPAYCDGHIAYCQRYCDNYDGCSDELKQYLAANAA